MTKTNDGPEIGRGYSVHGNWAELSRVPDAAASWAHAGLVVTQAGELGGFPPGRLAVFDRHGRLLRTVDPELTEGHGITIVQGEMGEAVWVCDPGFRFV